MTFKVVYLGADAFNSKVEKSLTGWAKRREILPHTPSITLENLAIGFTPAIVGVK